MGKKDSYWFKHDSTAGRGLRMRKMAHIHGHWGKGVYWDVIEILRDQENYSFPADESSLQFLADMIGVKDPVKFINWYRDCININLLKEEKNVFFSEILRENMNFWETKVFNGSKGGRPRKNLINNLIESEPITESKANRNHNITEQYITIKKSKQKKEPDSLERRKEDFAATLKPFLATYGKDMLNAFFKHWTEKSRSGRKFRAELQETWDVGGRLSTWAARDFGKKPGFKPVVEVKSAVPTTPPLDK